MSAPNPKMRGVRSLRHLTPANDEPPPAPCFAVGDRVRFAASAYASMPWAIRVLIRLVRFAAPRGPGVVEKILPHRQLAVRWKDGPLNEMPARMFEHAETDGAR